MKSYWCNFILFDDFVGLCFMFELVFLLMCSLKPILERLQLTSKTVRWTLTNGILNWKIFNCWVLIPSILGAELSCLVLIPCKTPKCWFLVYHFPLCSIFPFILHLILSGITVDCWGKKKETYNVEESFWISNKAAPLFSSRIK